MGYIVSKSQKFLQLRQKAAVIVRRIVKKSKTEQSNHGKQHNQSLKPQAVADIKGIKSRAVTRALIGGGGCIFIYSSSAWLVSFEIKLISKEVSRAKPEYMNIHPPPQLAF